MSCHLVGLLTRKKIVPVTPDTLGQFHVDFSHVPFSFVITVKVTMQVKNNPSPLLHSKNYSISARVLLLPLVDGILCWRPIYFEQLNFHRANKGPPTHLSSIMQHWVPEQLGNQVPSPDLWVAGSGIGGVRQK